MRIQIKTVIHDETRFRLPVKPGRKPELGEVPTQKPVALPVPPRAPAPRLSLQLPSSFR